MYMTYEEFKTKVIAREINDRLYRKFVDLIADIAVEEDIQFFSIKENHETTVFIVLKEGYMEAEISGENISIFQSKSKLRSKQLNFDNANHRATTLELNYDNGTSHLIEGPKEYLDEQYLTDIKYLFKIL
ncbi:hypothetical protein [Bacillus inaquosorum]|uniref:hypothetical protein n=1 Tax=Bacillus inaquosorum TaxID=483913 RepID=UPI00227FAA4C|nr:hypothetical protein [Bacillus inaquosorum]MCY8995779.1 hypothetical protein [Bacillus inaquosorum]